MNYQAPLSRVHNRSAKRLPAFLDELIPWARQAPDEIFAPNDVPVDIYTVIKSSLATPAGNDGAGGPVYHWESFLERKAALCEAMRVHAMFESECNWNEGVDVTNATSMRNKTGQETGVFQVSFDSEYLGHYAMGPFATAHGIDTVDAFITKMKTDHTLALEYYARLARISIRWAGPLLRHGADSVYPWLSRAAVAEFEGFLK